MAGDVTVLFHTLELSGINAPSSTEAEAGGQVHEDLGGPDVLEDLANEALLYENP